MKNVFENCQELSHVWAHQQQPSGRSRTTNFEGTKFFSYKTQIAELYPENKVALIAPHGRSHGQPPTTVRRW